MLEKKFAHLKKIPFITSPTLIWSSAIVTIRRRIEMVRGVNPNRLPSRVKGKISVAPTVTKVVITRYFP